MGLQQLTATRAITIYHPAPVVDSYNNRLDDWDNASSTTATGWLSQTGAQEVLGNRDAQIVDAILTVLPAVTVAANDRVTVADMPGVVYEVNGQPNRAFTPRGLHHIEANLREIRG